MPQYSASRCVLSDLQNDEKRLISNDLRFYVANLLTAALWVLFHMSRHTFATMELTLGADLYTTSQLLGHRDVETTQVYAKIVDAKKEAAVLMIDELFE